MIKFLFENFSGLPVVGTPIKVAYIAHLVDGVITDGKQSSSARDLKGLSGDELESAIDDEANDIFDEHIMPVIKGSNIPKEALDAAKEKACEKIAAKLREKADKKVNEKLGLEHDKLDEEEAGADAATSNDAPADEPADENKTE